MVVSIFDNRLKPNFIDSRNNYEITYTDALLKYFKNKSEVRLIAFNINLNCNRLHFHLVANIIKFTTIIQFALKGILFQK